MAKTDSLGLLEQHVEKGVLAVCGLLLLYALVHWLLSAPGRSEVPLVGTDMERVRPAKVDAKLLDAAQRFEKRDPHVDLPPLPPYVERIQSLRRHPFPDGLATNNWGRPRPYADGPRGGPGPTERVRLTELAEAIPAPSVKRAAGFVELLNRSQDIEVTAFHVMLEFARGKLQRRWIEKLRSADIQELSVVVARMDVERKEVLDDGTYGPVEKVLLVSKPTLDEDNEVIPEIEIPKYTGSNAEDVRGAVRELGSAQAQERVLRPDYWQVWSGDQRGWVDYEDLMPWGAKDVVRPAVAARPRPKPKPRPTLPPRRVTPGPGRGPGPLPGEGGVIRGGRPRTTRQPLPGEGGARRGGRQPTRGRRPTRGRSGPGVRPTPAPKPEPVVKEPAAEEVVEGIQRLLFHDTSAAIQRSYAYRARLFLVNPLLTYDDQVAEDSSQDALRPFVPSPWSEWFKVAAIPRTTQFFVTGAFAGREQLTVNVFSKSLGQPVMHKFKVSVGEVIGGFLRKTVMNPITRQPVGRDVNFATGAVAIEIDFDREILSGSGRFRKTQELFYLGDRGRLKSQVRVLDLDRDDPRRRQYDLLLERVRLAAEVAAGGGGEFGR